MVTNQDFWRSQLRLNIYKVSQQNGIPFVLEGIIIKNALKLQFKRLLDSKMFLFTLTLVTILSFVCIVKIILSFQGDDVVNHLPAWADWGYFGFATIAGNNSSEIGNTEDFLTQIQLYQLLLLPFVACLPFTSTFYDDSKKGIINSLIVKSGRKNYYISISVVVFVSAFVVVILPYILEQIVLCILCQGAPQQNAMLSPAADDYKYWIQYWNIKEWMMPLKMNHPYLYNILYMCIPAFTGAVFAELNYALSLYFHRNRFLILTLPAILLWIIPPYIGDVFLAHKGIPYIQWNLALLPDYPLSYIGTLILLLFIPAILLIINRIRLKRDVLI